MKLLLQERVKGLGEPGDVVDVSDGYGRNYLLPQRMALPNNTKNRRELETQKLLVLQREADRQVLAGAVAKSLKNALLQVYMKAQADGTLYGAVSSSVVVEVVAKAKGLQIEDRWVQLASPIKKIGDYDIELKMPGENACTFKLTVLPEGDQ